MGLPLSERDVVDRALGLPAFPRVVNDILATLEDDNATLGALARHVECDPVITARIVAVAHVAALGGRGGGEPRNVRMAISLIGMARVREIALAVSMAEFARQSGVSSCFWEHSVAVAIAAQELGRFTQVAAGYALVAGLLHDIGQLWMARFQPLEFQGVRQAHAAGRQSIELVEREYFGLDHCAIGGLLAEHWGLPAPVAAAIRHHHAPSPALAEKLVDVIHVAEVLANALDLTARDDNLVAGLSDAACAAIGLDWACDLGSLFGRIEARSAYACKVFR